MKFSSQREEMRTFIGFLIPITKKQQILLSICLILTVTFISLSPSLENDFVNWDDDSYVTENPLIMELSWNSIKEIFSQYLMGHYHPLTLLSYALEFHFFKLNPLAYHVTNLILHLMNALLVFLMILMLKGGILTSLVVSLLFGIHPLHVESVIWISQRKDVLYTFFFLGSLVAYLHYSKTKTVKAYLLSFLLFVLSLLSKSMAVSLPVIMVLCDFLLQQKFDRKCLIEKMPFFITAFIFGMIALSALGLSQPDDPKPPFSLINTMLVMSEALVFYVSKLILPANLSSFYPYIKGEAPWASVSLLIILGFLMVGVFFIITGKYRKIIFGLLFFLTVLLPILPLRVVADRYTYVSSIGVFFLFGEGFSWLFSRIQRDSRWIRTLPVVALIGVLGIFSFLTWERGQVWKESVTLWDDVLKKYPHSPKAYLNRGQGYSDRGEYDKALSDYTKAIEINPRYVEAYYNRANVHGKREEFNQALSDYTKAIEINPKYAEAYYNRGNVYMKREEFDQAISDYTKAIEINPQYVEAYMNRGTVYLFKEEHERSLSDLKKAIEIYPRYAAAYLNLAMAYEKIGRPWEAIQAYKGFIKNARPHYTDYIPAVQERIRLLSGEKNFF
jgi:tetratricopeptide (TPR) repeat protein